MLLAGSRIIKEVSAVKIIENMWRGIGLALAIGGWMSGLSRPAHAQCADGNCGNVGYADPYGGYGSGGYQAASHMNQFLDARKAGYATNGGYGTWGHRQVQPLFDNYFTQGRANQAEAALYISPTGVPGWVGHTYHTYQPLYPHQFLYQHSDKYHSYYDRGFGLNRTKASYWAPPVHTAAKQIYHKLELPR